MPELPDLTVYLESLASRIANRRRLRLGKRIVIGLEGELYLEFENGTLAFTEAGTKRRASLHLVEGKAALEAMNPGGIEVLECDLATFSSRLRSENHTLKRALTDPRLFASIGNAYSEKVTAFREEIAVHGRFGKPCPACGAPVQRIVYAENETNYCAR